MSLRRIYKITCPDPRDPQVKCPKKYDADCVEYKGEDLNLGDINKGDSVQTVIEKLDLIIQGILLNITQLDTKLNLTETELRNLITLIQNELNVVINEFRELEVTLCDRVAECDAVTTLEDKLQELEDTLCERFAECIEPDWDLVLTETGCSSSTTSYVAFDPNSSSNGYYVETYIDSNPHSKTYQDTKIVRVPSRDEECKGVGTNWRPTGERVCSSSQSTVIIDENYPENNIYGFKEEKDNNINSPTYNQTRWVRDTSHDNVCNPPSINDLFGMACSNVLDLVVSIGGGATAVVSTWTIEGIPEGWAFDEDTGVVTSPAYSDTDLSANLTVTATVEITDPLNKGWQIRIDGRLFKSGTGNSTETVTGTIKAKYTLTQFKEGYFYVCNNNS